MKIVLILSIFILNIRNAYSQNDSIQQKLRRIDTLNLPDSIKQRYKNILREDHVYVKIEEIMDTVEKRCEIHFKKQIKLSYKKEKYVYGKDHPPKVQVGEYVANNGKHRLKYPLEFHRLNKDQGITLKEYLSGCKNGKWHQQDTTMSITPGN